jgi:two-component system, chemotaxis family, response regulator Rcp1
VPMTEQLVRPIEILMVEDNPGDVRLTKEALADAKVRNTLSVVEDGRAALRYLRGEGQYSQAVRPDLILLDLNLPQMDGLHVLEAIKGDANLRRIPVVIITSSSAEEDILKSYDLHANCYVTKPLDLLQFNKVVRSVEAFWMTIVKLPAA